MRLLVQIKYLFKSMGTNPAEKNKITKTEYPFLEIRLDGKRETYVDVVYDVKRYYPTYTNESIQ